MSNMFGKKKLEKLNSEEKTEISSNNLQQQEWELVKRENQLLKEEIQLLKEGENKVTTKMLLQDKGEMNYQMLMILHEIGSSLGSLPQIVQLLQEIKEKELSE